MVTMITIYAAVKIQRVPVISDANPFQSDALIIFFKLMFSIMLFSRVRNDFGWNYQVTLF